MVNKINQETDADPPRHLDAIDRVILETLQENARTSSAELARRVRLSAPGLLKRLRKLEDDGLIKAHATLVRREAVGLDLLCFVQVTLAHHEPQTVSGFSEAIGAMAEVLECHHLTGDYDYLMKVVVRNHRHLERFLVEKLTPVAGVGRIRTSIVLREVKSVTALPLPGAPAGRRATAAGSRRRPSRGARA